MICHAEVHSVDVVAAVRGARVEVAAAAVRHRAAVEALARAGAEGAVGRAGLDAHERRRAGARLGRPGHAGGATPVARGERAGEGDEEEGPENRITHAIIDTRPSARAADGGGPRQG